ncbi:tRNA A37 threonylcarbamoyladenosine dehydratase [Rubritalea squalenifaciens DSM 18772]|uniref:tRNA A37 threonylcarbamoyladenosine dehydratase n=1 Tax=Rubritalea squalenifaciens DSM 18772 TaxID=1123071 RepID=A0A1M6L640_9BACT|nr:tRNA threonylcarbamoyladenosine dehydratase [Rubritalea squalenifaciens]SHJ66670.1 tRNA A37 threonylcarbamoyladenosine dehydratase [Rubritalea squalenifaciens DSM 18772]
MEESTISRFGGIARLYGIPALEAFTQAHVAVIGIGGVGSWTVEALARSGVGHITMVDLDEICVTNINRQLHAMDGNIGHQKTDAMEERIKAINPNCQITNLQTFYSERSYEDILAHNFDVVVDAIDRVRQKAHLLHHCKQRKVPVICCGGAGGLRDPSKIQIADISRVTNDALIAQVRNKLRSEYGFPKGDAKKPRKFGIEAIFSTEQPMYPQCDGSVSPNRPKDGDGQDMRLNCASGYGSITHMTATVGLFAAERALQAIIDTKLKKA